MTIMAALSAMLTVSHPPELWFIPPFVMSVLGLAALVDARTGEVPDILIFPGLLIVVASLAWFGGWILALERIAYVAFAVLSLRFVNNIYAHINEHDAIGFGDAKWTGLAVSGFGLGPVGWAWCVGAWLGLIWMGIRWLWRRASNSYCGHVYVHFAPFLFIGLALVTYKKQILGFLTAYL